jgi:hypothetical protein
LLIAYQTVIEELVDEDKDVYLGDTQAFDYFSGHQNEIPDNVHPNKAGHQHL